MMPENRFDPRPTAQQLDPLVFELLDPIHRLDDGARQRLLQAARHFRLEPGEHLDLGAVSGLMLYLVQGRVARQRPGTAPEVVHELHPGSAEPLIPDGLSDADQAATRIEALDQSEVIGFDRALYKHLLDADHRHQASDDLVLAGPEGILFKRLMEDFHRDRLQVPQLPELVGPILDQLGTTPAAADDDHEQSAHLIRLIAGQPALAIGLTRAAGTPSIPAAVVRLGPRRVRGLAVSEARRLAPPGQSPLVRERLIKAHRHSVEVAAFSHVIAAHHGRLDPDKALLCGLLHDVGTFAVLCRAADMMDRFGSVLALDVATRRLHGVIGGLMLGRWGYDRDVVMCAEGADDWRRDPNPELDYADIVLIAQLHSFIGSSRAHWLPQFNAVPAFGKLTGGAPSPAITRALLNQGRRRVLELASPLTAASLPT